MEDNGIDIEEISFSSQSRSPLKTPDGTPERGGHVGQNGDQTFFATPFSSQKYFENVRETSSDGRVLQTAGETNLLDEIDTLGEQYQERNDTRSKHGFTRMSLYRQFDPLATPGANNVNNNINNNNNHSNGMNHSLVKPSQQLPSGTPANGAGHGPVSGDVHHQLLNQTPGLMMFNTPMPSKNATLKEGGGNKGYEEQESPSNTYFGKPDVLLTTSSSKADEMIKLWRIQEAGLQEEISRKDQLIDDYKKKCTEYKNLVDIISSASLQMVQAFEEKLKERAEENMSLLQKCNSLVREKEQALEDVQGVEQSFSELHRRYEKLKGALELSKTNEEILQSHYLEIQEKLKEKEAMYEALKSRAEENVQNANVIIEDTRRANEREITVLRAQLKKAEMKIVGLQGQVDQKNHENSELTRMVDDLTGLKC